MRRGDDNAARRHTFLARIVDEFLAVHRRHFQIDDQQIDGVVDLRKRIVRMVVRLDVRRVRVAVAEESAPQVAVPGRIIDDDDAFHRLRLRGLAAGSGAVARRSYCSSPPTIVATTRPCSVSPMNGEFDAFERKVLVTWKRSSRFSSAMSAGVPARSVPPGRLKIRAGAVDINSISRCKPITRFRTSRSWQIENAVSSPMMPNGARSNSTFFSSK